MCCRQSSRRKPTGVRHCAKIAGETVPVQAEHILGKLRESSRKEDAKEEFELHDDKDKANTAIGSDQFGQGLGDDCSYLPRSSGEGRSCLNLAGCFLVPREDRC